MAASIRRWVASSIGGKFILSEAWCVGPLGGLDFAFAGLFSVAADAAADGPIVSSAEVDLVIVLGAVDGLVSDGGESVRKATISWVYSSKAFSSARRFLLSWAQSDDQAIDPTSPRESCDWGLNLAARWSVVTSSRSVDLGLVEITKLMTLTVSGVMISVKGWPVFQNESNW